MRINAPRSSSRGHRQGSGLQGESPGEGANPGSGTRTSVFAFERLGQAQLRVEPTKFDSGSLKHLDELLQCLGPLSVFDRENSGSTFVAILILLVNEMICCKLGIARRGTRDDESSPRARLQ